MSKREWIPVSLLNLPSILVFVVIAVEYVLPVRDSLPDPIHYGSIAGTNNDPNNSDLKYLIRVQGKVYFVNPNYSTNWTKASDYCRSFQLVLGRIDSAEEWEALTAALEEYPSGGVWTDARESRQPSMFVWNRTNTPISTDVVESWDDRYVRPHPYVYCSVFYSFLSPNFPQGMFPVPCGNNQTVLCQTDS